MEIQILETKEEMGKAAARKAEEVLKAAITANFCGRYRHIPI